ncbi:hypothetical protein ACO2Q7_05535 [Rathayibacter sp. KR2-224]|uniref:hypothetical protein n=1 Tax=Rathayibacter sp. KR2-224 TaxID=3400913 RepID=UPI003BFD9F85
MVRRLVLVLLAAFVAVAELEPASMTATSLLVALAVVAVAAAAVIMLGNSAAMRRPARIEAARDAWLASTAEHSPTHTDVRLLMRARPPSLTS